ncbi:MAG: SBBP repeat-containing protein [Bacteroidota bacterium]
MKYILLSLSLLFSQFSNAQTFQWASRIGDNFNDVAYKIVPDNNGNFYVTGYFRNTVHFGTTTLTGIGGQPDIFVAKINSAGIFQWAKRTGGADVDYGYGICLDANSNVYICGSFQDQAMIGNTTFFGPGAYIAKLDSAGNWIWSRAVTTTLGNRIQFNDVAVDSAENCFVTGSMNVNATFGSFPLTLTGASNSFVAKVNQNGQWLWAVNTHGIDYQYGTALDLDVTGNCYITGECRDVTIFGNDTCIGFQSVFVSKLSTSGQWLWTQQSLNEVNTNYNCRGFDIAVNSLGDAYITGLYGGENIFGADTISGHFANEHCFIAKINTNGQWQWVHAPGAFLEHDIGHGIWRDSNDNIYVCGDFHETLTFGPYILSNTATENIFAAKLNSADQWEWAVAASGSSNLVDANSIAATPSGVLVTGAFWDTVTIGTSVLVSATLGSADIFITMLDNLPTVTGEIDTQKNGVFPNPSSGKITFNTTGIISIYNTSGKKIYTSVIASSSDVITLPDMKEGIYFYQIKCENNNIQSGKILLVKSLN